MTFDLAASSSFASFRCWRCFVFLGALLLGFFGAADSTFASQQVELTWSPSPNADVAQYNVHFGTQSGSYPNVISYPDISDVIIPGLQDGQTYYFAVSAVDTNGNESVLSNEASYAVPVAPQLTLQAQASVVTTLAADLNWNGSSDSDVYAYVVNYGLQPSALTNSATFYYATTGTVTGLVAGATYYFAVAPIDNYGEQNAALSSPVSCTVVAPTPIILQAQPSAAAALAVDVSWNQSPLSGVYGYLVSYYAAGAGYTNSMMFYGAGGTIPWLAPGTNYFFFVSPVDYSGVETIASPQVSCTVTSPPPLVLQAQAAPSSPRIVSLTWNASPESAVYGYTIYYGTTPSNYDNSIYSSTTNVTISSLSGTNYYFAVAADDSYGDQYGMSNIASYGVPRPNPMQLQTEVFTDGNGQPYLMQIYTPSIVTGSWELDYSTDMQTWYPYTTGTGNGAGDGTDLLVDVWLDPSQSAVFFRALNY